jgi:hypothetical protein
MTRSASQDRRETNANRRLLGNAPDLLTQALDQAAVGGFFGEVRICATFQDGVAQNITVEKSQTIR